MSSGSQGWGQVQGHPLSLASLLPIPPHEQLLVTVVEGLKKDWFGLVFWCKICHTNINHLYINNH
jgi:hypothetical protein